MNAARAALGPRSRLAKLVLLGATLGLCACESKLAVELAVTAPEALERLELRILGVELLDEQGAVVTLESDADERIDLLAEGPDRLRGLVSDSDVPERNYRGLRLLFDDEAGAAEFQDGERAIVSISTTQAFMPLVLDLGRDEEALAQLVLDLRFSLADRRDTEDLLVLQQAGSAVAAGDSGELAGRVDEAFVRSGDCAAIDAGYAFYLFEGDRVLANDFLAQSEDRPLRSASLEQADGEDDYRYRFIALPVGRYTLAFTCEADRDDPFSREALVFMALTPIEVRGGAETRRDF